MFVAEFEKYKSEREEGSKGESGARGVPEGKLEPALPQDGLSGSPEVRIERSRFPTGKSLWDRRKRADQGGAEELPVE